MRREFIMGTIALAIFAGSALAQTAVVQISPEQRVKIKEYVVREKVKPVVIKDVTLGSALPSDVELVAVPSEWGPSFTSYRYVYWGNRVVLVEPSSRKVIQIIE